MRKWIVTLAGLVVCLGFTASTWACNTSSGEVVKTDAKSNTVVMLAKSTSSGSDCGSCGGEEVVFKLAKSTKVTINGKPAQIADLKAGDKVKVDYEKTDDVLSVAVTRTS